MTGTAVAPAGLRAEERLSGPRKAAILCIALGREKAAEIMKLLNPNEVEELGREIAVTPATDAGTVTSVLTEFRDVFQAVDAAARGGVLVAQEILEQAMGPMRARELLDRIRDQITETGLRRLKRATPELLLNVLRGEHPQTVALILAHLEARQAAGVISTMDPDLAGDVLFRVAQMDKIAPEVLAVVEAGLTSKTDLSLSQEMTSSGGPAAVAKVLNLTGASLERSLLESIDKKSSQVAGEVRALMFVFEDLKLLDGRAMQRILREVDGKELALALKAASEELKQHIFGSMSERAGAALKEELEFLGPVKVRDVDAAQTRIIEVMRSLEEQGEIVLGGRGGGDDVIA
ncbi:MAG: flagellar motor switch protein FliG [Gemmatimonadales bacterium]